MSVTAQCLLTECALWVNKLRHPPHRKVAWISCSYYLKNQMIYPNMGHGLLRRKCVKVNWNVLFNVLYICHRSSYSDSEPRMLPHSRFSLVIMVNPRSWSTLDGVVDYVPVLFAHVFMWRNSFENPRTLSQVCIYCYCSIAIVIPDTLRRRAASTSLSKNDLGSINRLSFRTVLESKGQYVSHLCKISGLK